MVSLFSCCRAVIAKIDVTLSAEATSVEISFVIPCHNEQDNLRALVAAIREATDPLQRTYEIVLVDDFSSDNSWAVLKELAANDPHVRGFRFAYNCGQSAALWAGMKESRGRYIVTLDADLQNDPRDIPEFIKALERADCVCGSRIEKRGHGDNFVRIASSRIANWVRNKLSGENVTDAGCCYRAFKRECVADSEILQRDAPLPADAVQDRGLYGHGDSRATQSAFRRGESLRRVEPAVRVVLRSARGALDAEADVQIQDRRENQLTGHAAVFDHHDEWRAADSAAHRSAGGIAGASGQRAVLIRCDRTTDNVLGIGHRRRGEYFSRVDFHQGAQTQILCWEWAAIFGGLWLAYFGFVRGWFDLNG